MEHAIYCFEPYINVLINQNKFIRQTFSHEPDKKKIAWSF
jgi:hypothetical protein